MFAWWTNRGFLTLLTLIGVWGVFGALMTFAFGSDVLDRVPPLWGIGLVLAAAVNWWVGSRLNHRPPKIDTRFWKKRLYYPAWNRFCGLPMETWSVPALILGLFIIIAGILRFFLVLPNP